MRRSECRNLVAQSFRAYILSGTGKTRRFLRLCFLRAGDHHVHEQKSHGAHLVLA
jgi:hypothetical protein